MNRFQLEDFFDEYEHKPNLVNLASSDSLPWNATALASDVRADIVSGSLGYANPKRLLEPLRESLALPADVGLLPTSGAAEAIAIAMLEIAQSRSGRDCIVALPSPSYGAFRGLTSLLGLKVKQYEYRPSAGWRPDIERMCLLANRCDAFIINSPHNPTGHVMTSEHLDQLAKILSSRGAVLIVDEVFRFPDEAQSAIAIDHDVVVLGSLSKTHGLPGLRLGWLAARGERPSRYRTLQQYLSLTVNSFSVTVGRSVLANLTNFDRANLIRVNRKIIADWAARLKARLTISAPMGGTTVCLTVDDVRSEEALFQTLLAAGVLIMPGNRCFERDLAKTWFRLGYGADTKVLQDGLARIEAVLHNQCDG